MEKITLTPKEKADELLNKMLKNTTILVGSRIIAKEQTIIAVDEILYVIQNLYFMGTVEYWQEVKNEIQKL